LSRGGHKGAEDESRAVERQHEEATNPDTESRYQAESEESDNKAGEGSDEHEFEAIQNREEAVMSYRER
jgi:hypothetical protein